MERFTKWNLPIAAIRRCNSAAIVPEPPIFNFTRLLLPNSSTPIPNFTRSYGVSSSPWIRLHNRGKLIRFDSRSKRFFWPKMAFGLVLSGGFLYFLLVKKVPYTNRNRILIATDDFARKLGEIGLQRRKKQIREGYALPATHPRSVQVCSILQKLVDTLHRDLGLDETPIVTCQGLAAAAAVNEKGMIDSSSREITGKFRKWNADIRHLKGRNWQVVVIDARERKAFSLGDGIIVVYTGLLDSLSDLGIATVLAHEVGHCVARHFAEGMNLISAEWYLKKIQMAEFVNINRLLISYERRVEIEADYISLLLMASAGYDPLEVLQVYVKLEPYHQNGENPLISKRRRLQLLSQQHVIEEARAVYRLATGNK